jgi:hypothetical protein
MSVDILVRFTDAQAAELKAEKAKTGCPTSEFIRRAVEDYLGRSEQDREQEPPNEEERIQLARFHGEKV